MRGRCVWLRKISPGEREMATFGSEREERQAWTHDRTPPPFKERLPDASPKQESKSSGGSWKGGRDGGPGPCSGRGPGDGGR